MIIRRILLCLPIFVLPACQAASSSDPFPPVPDNEWPVLLAQPQNQPRVNWIGAGAGFIEGESDGWGGGGIEFRDSPSHILEYSGRESIAREPRLFLPLLASPDTNVALAASSLYRFLDYRELAAADRAAIAAALRGLLDHPDMRLRWVAVQTLGENRLLTVADVAKGLSDPKLDIRVTTVSWCGIPREALSYYRTAASETPRDHRELNRALVPVLLAHLDDPDYRIRATCALRLSSILSPCVNHALPPYCDFVRASWLEYTQAKNAWQTWWASHSDEALLLADPDVPPSSDTMAH